MIYEPILLFDVWGPVNGLFISTDKYFSHIQQTMRCDLVLALQRSVLRGAVQLGVNQNALSRFEGGVRSFCPEQVIFADSITTHMWYK